MHDKPLAELISEIWKAGLKSSPEPRGTTTMKTEAEIRKHRDDLLVVATGVCTHQHDSLADRQECELGRMLMLQSVRILSWVLNVEHGNYTHMVDQIRETLQNRKTA